ARGAARRGRRSSRRPRRRPRLAPAARSRAAARSRGAGYTRDMRVAPFLVLLALLAPARAEPGKDASALARRIVEEHRSDPHRERIEVVLSEPGAVPARGEARIEIRRGRHAPEETLLALTLEPTGARLV